MYSYNICPLRVFPGGLIVKNQPANVAVTGNAEETATHSSVLSWRIPWTEGPGGLQSIALQRVRHSLENEHVKVP